jgi:hypothetical protein
VEGILVELLNIDGELIAEGIEFNGTLDLQATIPDGQAYFIRVSHRGTSDLGFLYDLEMVVF